MTSRIISIILLIYGVCSFFAGALFCILATLNKMVTISPITLPLLIANAIAIFLVSIKKSFFWIHWEPLLKANSISRVFARFLFWGILAGTLCIGAWLGIVDKNIQLESCLLTKEQISAIALYSVVMVFSESVSLFL